ncbi:MAG: hypothetical protein ACRC6E_13240 [Fusobacteriaceae bacterium]
MFRIGDKVWDIRFGWGVVVEIREHGLNNVGVKFGDFVLFYTQYGFYGAIDFDRSLFFGELVIPVSALIRPGWRGARGDKYYYVTSYGSVIRDVENSYKPDTLLFKTGNYFRTEKEAKESKFYKVFHD